LVRVRTNQGMGGLNCSAQKTCLHMKKYITTHC
jgi:hypothetical protein